MLASDVNNREFAGAMDPDAVMVARFYMRAIFQPFISKRDGKQTYHDVLYVEYYPAGNTLLKMDVPANDSHKQRFSKQYAYYVASNDKDAREAGTPLSSWAILSPADVENMRAVKFFTIENVAGASDQQLQSLGMGMGGMSPHILRARAQAYIGSASDTALPQKQAEDIELLKKQIADLTALLQAKPAEAKPEQKRKGRPPKAKPIEVKDGKPDTPPAS